MQATRCQWHEKRRRPQAPVAENTGCAPRSRIAFALPSTTLVACTPALARQAHALRCEVAQFRHQVAEVLDALRRHSAVQDLWRTAGQQVPQSSEPQLDRAHRYFSTPTDLLKHRRIDYLRMSAVWAKRRQFPYLPKK